MSPEVASPESGALHAPLTGGCLCGAVRYEAGGRPREVANCHCSMCRRASGAAFLTYAAFARDRVRFTRGSPAAYRSSEHAVRGHCAACGSPLTYVGNAEQETLWLALGSFDEPNRLPPTAEWHVATRLDWVRPDPRLPHSDGTPGEG